MCSQISHCSKIFNISYHICVYYVYIYILNFHVEMLHQFHNDNTSIMLLLLSTVGFESWFIKQYAVEKTFNKLQWDLLFKPALSWVKGLS